MNKIKHFGQYLWFLATESWRILHKRWFWMTLVAIIWTYFIMWFASNYEVRSSFKFGIYQRGVGKSATVATESAKLAPIVQALEPLSEEQIVMLQPHGDILWKVYQLETQRGKTDWCRLNGKGYGGFGVKFRNAENKSEIACYDTFQKASERAEYWIVQNGIDKDIVNALCTWNIGPAKLDDGSLTTYQNCSYYQSYLTL